MAFTIWPTTIPEDQTKLSYIFLSLLFTSVFGYLWWHPLGFIMAMFWSLQLAFNVMWGPAFVPGWDDEDVEETQLSPDQEMQAGMMTFLGSDKDRMQNEINKLKQDIEDLRK